MGKLLAGVCFTSYGVTFSYHCLADGYLQAGLLMLIVVGWGIYGVLDKSA